MWKLRIEQYFQVQDYALWEVIEYGNSFKPVARTTTNADGTSTSTIPGPVTTEKKEQKKNDVKARSMLLMALPNEHQLAFSQYKDGKTLFEAIQARFGGNKATKKTQKTLLKQMYENFSASSQESLDSISNRLQKIVSQLAILGENISQEDLNFKFLKPPSEIGVFINICMLRSENKPDLGTISLDDLYNNFKIVEQEDSTASAHVNTTSTNNSTASLSDATVYAFLANQPNGSQVVHEDLEQIHEDDLEEMDLKCDTAGYDKSKVECFNCHKMGHFARECRGPRNQESRPRNQESSKRTVNMEDTSSKAMYDSLRVELNKSGFDLATYKRGLASVEEQLVFYKKNEVMLCDQIAVLKKDASFKDSKINALNIQIEKLKKEKESNQIKIDNFENASKNPDKLIGSLFAPPTIDLSSSGLKEFQQPEFEGYGVNVNKSVSENSSNEIKRTIVAPIIEDWPKPEQTKQPRKISENLRNNKTNWNEKKTQKLGLGFQFTKKACFVCESFNHLIKDFDFHDKRMVQKPIMNNVKKGTGQREVRPVWNNALRTNHQNFSNSRRNFAPTAVLTKSGIVPISTARQNSSRAAAPLTAARPINTYAPKLFGDPQVDLKDTWIFDSGCSRNMTGNKSFLTDYQDYDGGFVAFAGSSKGGRITGKGKIKTGKLDFEDVYFVKELKFNLFIFSQMYDKKNSVLFTEIECLILSPDFKLPDENQVMLKIPKKDNMYSFDLKNVVPSKGLTCLIAKATNDESNMRHRRLGHINFKTMNKLVKGNLVRGLPSKIFENDHSCVACQKGKQHKASLVTDDYSRFSWVFFLAKKDETSGILKNFITGIENQLNHKVKIIRCDNGTEFKNYDMNQFCGIKGIKREFSNARTPQQNGVAERKNRTLIEAARTMLADSLLPIPFWAEAVNTACYVQNRVLVTKPHNKTPYELLIGRTPIISFMRPFGCPVTILNTLDHLGKFDGKADEGFLVGSGPEWLFDIDTLTNSMNYHPVNAGNRTNGNAGLETNSDAGQAGKENVPDQEYILLPLLHTSSNVPSNSEKVPQK
ncbi:putative ribonuclease H-like domain-containing protein, partial [Tanacetum coccineum]